MGQQKDLLAIMSKDLDRLQNEIKIVLSYTRTLWDSERDIDRHHFPYMLYGFVMVTMAKIDFLSKHFILKKLQRPEQTRRMVAFMHHYLGYDQKASEIAVQFFRHNLMHTSTLEPIHDKTGMEYRWLLHYGVGTDLPRNQHMTLGGRKLNAGALYFVEDLISVVPSLRTAIQSNSDIQAKWQDVESEMRGFKQL